MNILKRWLVSIALLITITPILIFIGFALGGPIGTTISLGIWILLCVYLILRASFPEKHLNNLNKVTSSIAVSLIMLVAFPIIFDLLFGLLGASIGALLAISMGVYIFTISIY